MQIKRHTKVYSICAYDGGKRGRDFSLSRTISVEKELSASREREHVFKMYDKP